MLFTSLPFYVFFPIVTLGYFLLPHRFRWMWLLAASAYFYMAFLPVYILVIASTILVDFFAGIAIETSEGKRRKAIFLFGLLANLGVLGFFKYYNFFNGNLDSLASWLGWNYPLPALTLALPIGLSFHTFKSMSYLIEINQGNQKAERHFGILALFVMFYPPLVSGPIDRPGHLLPQLHAEHKFNHTDLAEGLRLMMWGFFKKLVIADRLAQFVNPVYENPAGYSGPLLILTAAAFAYQIYCDFSGYSDIAIGAARVLGIRLMTNFDRPFAARSLAEFWQRWHISLSSWLRDYIFFPLRRALLRRKHRLPDWLNQAIPTLVTMLASGLWHGAAWTFILWGGLHGLFLTLEQWTAPLRARLAATLWPGRLAPLRSALQALTVFALFAFSLIFFRSPSLSAALDFIARLPHGWDFSQLNLWLEQIRVTLGLNYPLALVFPALSGLGVLTITLLQIIFLEVVQSLQPNPASFDSLLSPRPTSLRWTIYYLLAINIILFGSFLPSTFIYFQF
jgi:D-alanyl-lipoteichoic acid acyltransferase DltB (MBOAT superfamily)